MHECDTVGVLSKKFPVVNFVILFYMAFRRVFDGTNTIPQTPILVLVWQWLYIRWHTQVDDSHSDCVVESPDFLVVYHTLSISAGHIWWLSQFSAAHCLQLVAIQSALVVLLVEIMDCRALLRVKLHVPVPLPSCGLLFTLWEPRGR